MYHKLVLVAVIDCCVRDKKGDKMVLEEEEEEDEKW